MDFKKWLQLQELATGSNDIARMDLPLQFKDKKKESGDIATFCGGNFKCRPAVRKNKK